MHRDENILCKNALQVNFTPFYPSENLHETLGERLKMKLSKIDFDPLPRPPLGVLP